MGKRKKDTGIIVVAIFLFVIVAIPTGQALVAFPEPGVAWHNPTKADVTDVAVGDLTGNGVSDVAYVDVLERTTLTAVYGTNGTVYWTNSSVSGYSIAVGDVDGDGKNEVVAGGWNDDEKKPGITVFEDNGTVKFFYETSSGLVKDIELGDVDNDGVADIVACNLEGYGMIYAFKGTDGGTLPDWPKVFYESIEDLALGNLDENPGLDIAAISYGIPGTLYVYNSTGALMWSNDTVLGRSVEIGDVDGDTEAEVVIGDYLSQSVIVYDGDSGVLEYAFPTNSRNPTEVELGDLDGDTNDLEIAVITGFPCDLSLFALAVNSGQLNELWNFSIEWEPRYYGEGLAIGDVDGDGGNEVVALSDTDDYGGGFKVWAFDGWDGNGDGQGDVVWMFPLPSHPNDVEVGDVDGDGDMEVLVGTDHELAGSVYALFTKQPALEVNKTVWDPVNETWVKELTAKINDTLRFNCTITNTGNVILTKIRFRDILDCSLVYVEGDEYKFKPNVLHPDNCSWNLSNPLAYIFTVLCPESTFNPFDPDLWDDTNGDGNVSVSDQIYFEGYGWYHVDRVPYTLNVSNATHGTKYFDSALSWDDPGMDLSNPLNSTWLEVCCCKDTYTLINWTDYFCSPGILGKYDIVTLRNERTLEVVQYTVEEVAKDLVVSREYEFDLAGAGLEPGQVINEPTYQALVVRCGVDTNTLVAKGKGRDDNYWTYSDPAVVTITVPCPSGDAADATPAVKDLFTAGEDVYALAHNFAPNKNVSIYITPVRTWAYGDIIADYAIVGPMNTTTDANGSIGIYPQVLVWPNSIPGQWHIVFDDPDGLYEPGVDLYDYFEVIGVAAVPLNTPIGLIALVSLLSAIAAVAIVRKRR